MPPPEVVSPPAPATGNTSVPSAAEEPVNDEDGSGVSHKKVIKPLSEPTEAMAPNLNELLAKEGIDSLDDDGGHPYSPPAPQQPGALPTAPHPPGHVISPNSGQNGVDPNSIAL